MEKIFMNVQDLELKNNKIKQIPFNIFDIIQSYTNIINSLNKEIRYRANINYDHIYIKKKLDNCEYNSEQLHLVLSDAIEQYQKTEMKLHKLLNDFEDTTTNNKSVIDDEIKTNIEDILKTKYNIFRENNINDILNRIPELKEKLSFSPYTTTGKIYEIQKFLNKKGYVTDLTGQIDAQTRNSLLLYTNFNNSIEFNKVDKITLPKNNFVNEDTENYLHSDGFGKRGDNYYICNLGYKDYFNLYTVSAEAGYSKVLQKNNIDLSAALGASALDLELNSGNIGSKNLYGNANGEVELLTAEAKGDVKWGKSGYGFSGKAMAAGATGQAKATISIFGIDISLTGEGYAGAFGAGIDVMYEYKNGKREMKLGARASALFGCGGGISISW